MAGRARGFTLIELLVVVALIAIASAVVSLSLRDPAATRLEQEGARLAALLEAARGQARISGMPAAWLPTDGRASTGSVDDGAPARFRFTGLPASNGLPDHWLNAGVSASVVGAAAVGLGPEPLIGAQRIVLSLGAQRLVLATDGIGPFVLEGTNDATPSAAPP